MKIVHVFWALLNGGIENMLVDIINLQIHKSNEVSVIVINNLIDNSIVDRLDNQCKLICLGRKKHSKSMIFVFKLNFELLKQKFDVIHLHYDDIMKYIWIKGNYFTTVHNTHLPNHNFRWHKGIIAISRSVKEELDAFGFKQSVVINNGINFSLIKGRRHNPSKVFRIVNVSRLVYAQKGQDILLEAIRNLKDKGIENIHVDFIGDGENLQDMERYISENKLSNNVSLLGNKKRSYIYQHLSDYDLFVQPSRFEGFGLTVVEAMAAYVPVLVSRNEGPLEIIGNGKYGYCFENGSAEDCAKMIKQISINYPNIHYLSECYNHVKELYNVENTALKYLEFYMSKI